MMCFKKCLAVMLVVLTGVVSSCQYDDDELWDSVNDLAARVSALENLTKQMNGDISAVQGIVSALEKNVSVSSVESLTDGYVIHFSDGTKAVIKNGADGKDGAAGTDGKDGKDGKDGLNAPAINIAKEGGVYYWTITTDGTTTWLLDEDGKKLPVSGKKGANGATGMPGAPGANGNDGITPLLKVDTEGYWMVSYDKGVTYDYVKNANGDKVSALGQSGNAGSSGAGGTGTTTGWLQFDETAPVKDNGDGTITIKMADGTEFVLAKGSSVVYKMGTTVLESTQNLSLGASGLELTYKVAKIENPSVEILKAENVKVTVNKANSTLSIKQATGKFGGKAVIMYYNEGKNVTSVLTFASAQTTVTELNNALKEDGSMTVSLDAPLEGTSNVISLPAASENVEKTIVLTDIEAGAALTINERTANQYQGTIVIEIPEGEPALNITVNTPDATVIVKKGKVSELIVSSGSLTTVITEGAEVDKLVVKKGHVLVEDGKVGTISRSDDNSDAITYIFGITGTDTESLKYQPVSLYYLLKAAQEGGYITMTEDIALVEPIVVQNALTIDLNGHKITPKNATMIKVQNTQDALVLVSRGGSLTINDASANGAIDTNGKEVMGAIKMTDSKDAATGVASLVINGGTIKGRDYAVMGNGMRHNTSVQIIGGKLEGGSAAIFHPQYGELAISGGQLTGVNSAVEMRAGILNITGGALIATKSGELETSPNGSGSTIKGAAVAVSQHSTNQELKVSISGESALMKGVYALYEADLQDEETQGISMSVSGGTFQGAVASENCKNFISGGTFSVDPSEFLEEGCVAENEGGNYKVVIDEVVKIGSTPYPTMMKAVAAAQNGDKIILLKDVTQQDGVLITDKNLTIDLNGKTFTVTEGSTTNNRNFKINGTSTVTIQNGTMIAQGELTSGAYGTVRTEGTAKVTLDNVKLYSYRGYGLNVKACTGTEIKITNSEIYAQYSGGVEAAGGTIKLENVEIDQKGVCSGAAWCSVAIGVNGGGKVIVTSGNYNAAPIGTDENSKQGTWVAYVMSSGGTLTINGGTFNGTVAESDAAANACGLICADRAAVVYINGGEFNSNGKILDMRNNEGTLPNPVVTLAGGTFSADPRVSMWSSNLIHVAEDFEVKELENGKWELLRRENKP